MRLIANMPSGRLTTEPEPSAMAYLTSIGAGYLMSVVIHVDDKRLVGGRLITGQLPAPNEAMVCERLQAFATRLLSEASVPSVISDHVQNAAHVLAMGLAKRSTAEKCFLSSKAMSIATEILGSELRRSIHASQVARACGVSEGHLRRAFRTSTGVSPREWRRQRRLQFCREQLVTSDRSLAQIARDAGFVAQSNFSRVFYQSTGMNPSEWRRVFQSAAKAEHAAFAT